MASSSAQEDSQLAGIPPDSSLAIQPIVITTQGRKRKIEGEYVRQPYVRKPYISVSPAKTTSGPWTAAGDVNRREERKITALPPPTKSKSTMNPNKRNEGDAGEGEHKGGSNGRDNGRDDEGGNDGDDDDEDEDQQMKIKDSDEEEEEEDASEYASASSTPWPEDAFTDMSAPDRYIIPASPNAIAAALSEVRQQEGIELTEVYEEVFAASAAAAAEAGVGSATLTASVQMPNGPPQSSHKGLTRTREFRRKSNLDGPGWRPCQGINPWGVIAYQLFASGCTEPRSVWRYLGHSDGRERAQVPEAQSISPDMLEKAGWVWRKQRSRWDRKPDPEEEIPLTRVKLRLEIPPLPEDLQTLFLQPANLEILRRFRRD